MSFAAATSAITSLPPRLQNWTTARFGMSLHWGLYSLPGRGEWLRSDEQLTVTQYQAYFDNFNPDTGCTQAWAAAAREAGAKHVVLTAKHHDGFCLWDSELTTYTSMHTPCRRDLIREYVGALREQGLSVGLYYSLVDWHHADYGPVFRDRQHPLRHDPSQEALDCQRDWGRYLRFMHGQVEELLTQYGKIDVLYFDFSYWNFAGETWGATDLMRMVRRHQPDIVINDRLGNEAIKSAEPPAYVGDFDHAEQNIPREPVRNAAGRAVPWEAWFTLSNSWCYSRTDRDFKSAATVIHALVNCVSKNGNLCLNVGPDALGHLGEVERNTLRRIGDWLRVNGQSIYAAGSADMEKPEWGYYTMSNDRKYLFAHVLAPIIGHLSLKGLRGVITNPIVLTSGLPGVLSGYWNPGVQTFDAPDDVFFNFRSPVAATWPMPDAMDTVIRFELVHEPAEQQAIIEQMRVEEEQAKAHHPIA